MFGSQRGSAAGRVALAVILLAAAAAVLYCAALRDKGEEAEAPGAASQAATPSRQDQGAAAEPGSTGSGSGSGMGPGQGSVRSAPGSNVRDEVAAVSPPVDTGEEALAAVLQSPEALDWYWAVDDPRYEATDSGSYYVVRLYAVVPAEGTSPESQAEFGRWRVDKQTAAVSDTTR